MEPVPFEYHAPATIAEAVELPACDEDGNPLTTTLMDDLLPTATDVPGIESGHIETPGPRPGGCQGVARERGER